jgi:CheY-like chemotaxis protein
MSCITLFRGRRHWIGSRVKSSQRWRRSSPDINKHGMDGLQALGEIKRRLPDLAVMMVTAYGDDERRQQAAEYGAADFLAKSVDFDLST